MEEKEMPVDVVNEIDLSFKYFGLEPTASLAAAKEAYRRYVKEFHPDKFPAGSDAQKMAAEKMIAANSHFEKLKKFFQEYPNGKPAGTGTASQEPHSDSDWEAWEKQRHNAFETELKEWQQRQTAIEKEKSTSRETLRRRKLLLYVRVGLVLATLAMWKGWGSADKTVDDTTQRIIDQMEASRSYDLQTHGMSHSAYALSDDDINHQWDEKENEALQTLGIADKRSDQPGKCIPLMLWSGVAGWVLLSKKGKAMAENYLAKASN